jgi:hypothetical protein
VITLEAMGLAEAQELTDFYIAVLGEYSGCYYKGTKRNDGKTNAEVVGYLAEGNNRSEEPIKRDLRTFSDKVAGMLGEAWKQVIENVANSMVKKSGGFKKAYASKAGWERAKIASARAWKAAGMAVLEEMSRRHKEQLTADAQGNESPADLVGVAYAMARQKKYGVNPYAVYIATGQLQEDLQPEAGRIALTKGGESMSRLNAAAEVASLGKAIGGMIKGSLK